MTAPTSALPAPAADPVSDLKAAAARAFCGRNRKHVWEQVALGLFIGIPLAALLTAGFVMWGWGLGYRDVVIGFVMYWVAGHGITVGFHRYFTHGSFKAKRPLRIASAVAGTLAIQGPVIRWVADHRKHHAFSDQGEDPHSPWRYGNSVGSVAKGLWHAHIGWLFDVEQTDPTRYAPDFLPAPTIVAIPRWSPRLPPACPFRPPPFGGFWSWSCTGGLPRFFRPTLGRVP